jgi:hypothetical protein
MADTNTTTTTTPGPPEKKITLLLESSDGNKFTVDNMVINASVMLKDFVSCNEEAVDAMAQYAPQGAVQAPMEIKLREITGKMLAFVIEYVTHYEGKPPVEGVFQSSEILGWDKTFIAQFQDADLLIELFFAAKYMGIRSLFVLCAKFIAERIKGKTRGQIHADFKIRRQYTKKEIEIAMKNPLWVDDPSLPLPAMKDLD